MAHQARKESEAFGALSSSRIRAPVILSLMPGVDLWNEHSNTRRVPLFTSGKAYLERAHTQYIFSGPSIFPLRE